MQSPNYPSNYGSYEVCTIASVATERCLWMNSQLKNDFDDDDKRYFGLTGPRMHRRPRGRQCGRRGVLEKLEYRHSLSPYRDLQSS